MDGDAEASGVGGAGLAAGGEFLGEIEELLTGAEGALHPYTSAHGGGRGKAGVSRPDTFKPQQLGQSVCPSLMQCRTQPHLHCFQIENSGLPAVCQEDL